MKYVAKQWFLVGIAAVVALAFQLPQAGKFIKEWNVLKGAIFLAFLTTGLTLDTRQIAAELRNFKALLAAAVTSFVVFPAATFLLARLLWPGDMDMIVGACILGVAPVTVASGTILAKLAKGNVPLSIFICVATSLIAIFTIGPSLKLLLQSSNNIDLPVGKMIASLLLIVLLPTIIGQLLRIPLAGAITPWRKCFSVFAKLVVLLIIFNAVASSASRITDMGVGVVMVFAFATAAHVVMLAVNFAVARLIGLDRPSTATFTIHCSQKTLTVSSLVWAGFFAAYSSALVPVIAYHIVQMLLDTLVAERFGATSRQQD